jgi:hypothetical protein
VPVLDKGFQEGVRGGVFTLAWLVDECDKGACHDGKFQRLVHKGMMKIPCAIDFWFNCCGPLFVGNVENWSVLVESVNFCRMLKGQVTYPQHHGKMDDPLDRPASPLNSPFNGFHIFHFASNRRNRAAHALQFCKDRLVRVTFPGTSREENQVSGPLSTIQGRD